MAYFFTEDHCRIYYEVHGKGEQTIVFINGGSCSYRYWYRQMSLADNYRLVFADLRGHGNSEAVPWGYSNERFAEDVRDLVHYLDLRNVWLCGWSCGASYALEYFRLHGDDDGRIKGIIYDDMSVKPSISEDGENLACWGTMSDKGAVAYLNSLLDTGAGGALRFGEDPEKSPMPAFFKYDDKCGEYKRLMNTVSPANPAAVCLLNVSWLALDHRAVLSTVNIPFLLIEGGAHIVYQKASYDYVAEHVPGCKRVVFEGAGHALHMEFAEEFNRTVDAFIEGRELPASEPCIRE